MCDAAWRERLAELINVHAETGRVPARGEGALGAWVATQRANRATMHLECLNALERVSFWRWDPEVRQARLPAMPGWASAASAASAASSKTQPAVDATRTG